MIPLYEVWQANDPNGFTWGVCFEGYTRVALPLPWAKAYAAELAERSGHPTEVRGIGKNYRKVKAYFEKVAA